MEVMRAGREDIPLLCEFLELLFTQEAEFQPDTAAQAEGLRQIIDFPERGQILILRDGTSPIGMANLLFTVSTALGGRVVLLEDLVVRPERRGCGAGSMLLRGAVDFAASAGCRRITLLTDRVNEPAQKFYMRHGFKLSEMVPMRLIF